MINISSTSSDVVEHLSHAVTGLYINSPVYCLVVMVIVVAAS